MNVALDTNVLAYAEGLNDIVRRDAALSLLEALPTESTLIPVQALGELFHVLVRKAGRSRAAAAAAILSWGDTFPLVDSSSDVLLGAIDVSRVHGMSFWDGIIVSAAADARCRLLLSEDLAEGFTWRGVTIVNPFAADRHPLLTAAMRASSPSTARGARTAAKPRRRPASR